MIQNTGKRRQRGYILIATAISAVALISMLGVAVDIGRIYIIKSEAQSYADSASIAAALELDGTTTGITDARNAVTANVNRWNFSTQAFSGTTVDFAQSLAGPWVASPNPATGYGYARVWATTTVNLLFMPVVVPNATANVTAKAIAAQVPKTTFREGLFPFSPFAHNSTGPDFGLSPGSLYTLRWPSSPKIEGNQVCQGDRSQAMIDIASAQGGAERGFIEDNSSSVIRSTIVDDYQSVFRTVGDIVSMTGGVKQTQLSSLNDRIHQDSDSSSATYADYLQANHGNGRRIIAAPINDGGTPPGFNNRIVGIGAFFLQQTGDYGNGGGQSWCAEYIGTWVQGSNKHGVGDGLHGSFVVRLVD